MGGFAWPAKAALGQRALSCGDLSTSDTLVVSLDGVAMAKLLPPVELPLENPRTYRFFLSTRFFILMLGFLGVTNLSISYASIGFAMVCMVNSSSSHAAANASLPPGCHRPSSPHRTAFAQEQLEWDDTTRANIMAAFGWGAIWLLAPAGWLADRYGPRLLFALGNITCAATFFLFPTAAAMGPWYAFAARFLTGMCSAVSFPCFIGLLSRWAPVSETGTFLGLGTIGYPLGAIAVMLTSGLLCTTLGWEYIFYGFGTAMALLAVVWLLVYRDDPADVCFISPEEAEYIKAERCHSTRAAGHSVRPPWRRIFTSPPALAALMSQFSFSWIVYFIAMYLPTYQEEVLLVDLQSNGLYAALPYVAQTLGRSLMGPLSDQLGCWGRSWSIKTFNSICLGVPCLAFLALTLLDCRSAPAAIALFSISHFAVSSQIAGFQKSYMFIAPHLAGTLSALGQITGFCAAIIMPYVVGWITRDGRKSDWQTVMYICSAVALFGLMVFLLCGSGEEQSWSEGGDAAAGGPGQESAERLCADSEPSISASQPLPALPRYRDDDTLYVGSVERLSNIMA